MKELDPLADRIRKVALLTGNRQLPGDCLKIIEEARSIVSSLEEGGELAKIEDLLKQKEKGLQGDMARNQLHWRAKLQIQDAEGKSLIAETKLLGLQLGDSMTQIEDGLDNLEIMLKEAQIHSQERLRIQDAEWKSFRAEMRAAGLEIEDPIRQSGDGLDKPERDQPPANDDQAKSHREFDKAYLRELFSAVDRSAKAQHAKLMLAYKKRIKRARRMIKAYKRRKLARWAGQKLFFLFWGLLVFYVGLHSALDVIEVRLLKIGGLVLLWFLHEFILGPWIHRRLLERQRNDLGATTYEFCRASIVLKCEAEFLNYCFDKTQERIHLQKVSTDSS